MELKHRVHLAGRVDIPHYYSLAPGVPTLRPACGRVAKLFTQDIELVDCVACLTAAKRKTPIGENSVASTYPG